MTAPLDRLHVPDVRAPELLGFWEGCRARELRIPRCTACGRFVWYPQPACPACGGECAEWAAVAGRARLFTWVVVHRPFLPGLAPRLPFTTALVALEEDPAVRLATWLDNPRTVPLRIGLPLELFFDEIEPDVVLPRFRVAGQG